MLLGRAPEQERLGTLLESARQGASAAAVITGEAGIGKSALLNAVVARADGMTVLRARGFESESELAFSGLAELLRPVEGRLSSLRDAQRDALQGALALGPPSGSDPLVVFIATLNLLAAAADELPVLVVVDDAQWLDRPTASALAYVGRHLHAEGVVLLVATRDGAGAFDADGLEVLALGPLDRTAAAELARRMVVADAVASRLAVLTGGNPLALIELTGTLTEEQRVGIDALGEPVPSSGWAEHVFGRRLGELPDHSLRALLVAAAAGREDMLTVARALAADGLEVHTLEAAESAGLVTLAGGRLQFRHPLIRSAAYHLAAAPDRRSAHLAVAASLIDDDRADERAWHLAAAAVEPDAAVAEQMERAGRAAAQRGGYATAVRALRRAAVLAPDGADRERLMLDAADAAQRVGAIATALDVLDEVDELRPAGAELARAELLRGRIEARTGSTERAYELMVSAASRLETLDPVAAVLALVESVDPCIRAGRPADALATAERAARAAEGLPGSAPLYAQLAIAAASVFTGRVEDASRLVLGAAEAAARSDDMVHDLQLRAYLGMTLAFAEEWERAQRFLTALVADCERLAPAVLPYPLVALGWLQRGTGEWGAAVTNLELAVRYSAEAGRDNDECWAHSVLAWIRAAQGRAEEVERHIARQLEVDRELGLPYQVMTTDAARGLLALGAGDGPAAIPHLERALERKQRYGYSDASTHPSVTPDLVEALVRAGRAEEAAALAERFAADAVRPSSRAMELRCRALLSGDDAAPGLFEQAIELHTAAGDPFAGARSRLLLGERLRRMGLRRPAREHLEAASAVFEELGAAPLAARAAKEQGRTARRLRPAEEARDELTPSEHQVASLVVQGLSNRDIAQRMFLSVKSVEAHLTRIYRKLDVRSRFQLMQLYQPDAGE
jgi:DNA-binding NarL/FixJ family response regulator